MSVQFGIWNCEGQPPGQEYIEKVSATLTPYGPDSNERYSNGGVTMLYRAFHTTNESHWEVQPHVTGSGAAITWDGRLDNRGELIGELCKFLEANRTAAQSVAADSAKRSLAHEFTDVEIVAAAYDRWKAGCFAKLIGDWALAIWNPREPSVLLAKDPIGTKHLYYSLEQEPRTKHSCRGQVTWSTILDPLVVFASRTFLLCEAYIAGWLSCLPEVHLTPYVGIHAVPPSCSVLLRPGRHGLRYTITKYWDFDSAKRIRYRSDAEYEEHFRSVFGTAVQRRLRSDRPVLAELSGGLDSSSIVCMADTVIAHGAVERPRVDTISWYDDSYDHIEPDTNERRWFTKVEEKRGRTGFQIHCGYLQRDATLQGSFESNFDNDRFAPTPQCYEKLTELHKRYAAHMRSQGYRVTLSGIGGDEVTFGDVPTPIPELQNLLARARILRLAHQLNAWAMKMRTKRLPLLWKAAHGFFAASLTGVLYDTRPAPWLQPGFVHRNYSALCGYPSRVKLFGPLPSFQEHVVLLNVLRRLLAAWPFRPDLVRDLRFPFLDRHFLEFLYAIPREQLVGVGKRRFLMKRSLLGIVPDELLNRRRKALPSVVPRKESSSEWPSLAELGNEVVASSNGIIDSNRFLESLQKAHNESMDAESLNKALKIEFWLRHLTVRRVLRRSDLPRRLKPILGA